MIGIKEILHLITLNFYIMVIIIISPMIILEIDKVKLSYGKNKHIYIYISQPARWIVQLF